MSALPSMSPLPPTLQSLAERAAAGERGAFDAIVGRLSVALRRMIEKRTPGDSPLAEELCQQAWGEVWRALVERRYDARKAAITTFVYAVAHKVWLRHVRAAGRTIPECWRDAGGSAGSIEPAEASAFGEELESVRAVLRGERGGLSDEERWILRASASGVSDRELAAKLGIAPSSANARKKAALEKMRAALEERSGVEKSRERGGGGRG